jgi:hypothetical protein
MNTAGVILYPLLFVPVLVAAVSYLKRTYKSRSKTTPQQAEEHDRNVNNAIITTRATSLAARKRRGPNRFDPLARNAQFMRDQAWKDYERQYNAWVNLNSNNPNPPPPPMRPRAM